jgi:hypothetical protein
LTACVERQIVDCRRFSRSAAGRSGNLASNNLNVIAAEGGRVFSSISKENEKDALFCWQFHKSLHCLSERHLGAAATPRYNFVKLIIKVGHQKPHVTYAAGQQAT